MLKLTALILTYNEEETLDACLQSASWADETLVVDSFSTDRTLDIAQRFGARVLQHEFITHAKQKNWAIPQATHEWVLILDADERVTDELRNEIQHQLRTGPDHDLYIIYRRSFLFGREIKHCGWDRDKVIRFIHRDRCRYNNASVHEEIEVNGTPGVLQGKLLHYPYRSFDQFFVKFERYTTWAAQDLDQDGVKAGFINLFLRPWFRFFKTYVLRLGFLDGKAGLVLSGMLAFYVFVKYARLWHMHFTRNTDKHSPAPSPP